MLLMIVGGKWENFSSIIFGHEHINFGVGIIH